MIKETTLTIEEIENIPVGRPDSPFYIKKKVAKLQEKERNKR